MTHSDSERVINGLEWVSGQWLSLWVRVRLIAHSLSHSRTDSVTECIDAVVYVLYDL